MLRTGCAATLLFLAALAGLARADSPEFEETGEFSGSYLCVSQAAGGVRWVDERNEWQGVAFSIGKDDQFVIKINAAENREWESFGFKLSAMTYLATLREFGESGATSCWGERIGYHPSDLVGFGHILMSSDGAFRCDTLGGLFNYQFNLGNLRFMKSYLAGFLDGKDSGGNTPSVTVGKCARVD